MLKVRDIMTSPVTVAAPGQTVESAAWKLGFDNVGGLPVRNAGGRVIGVLSKTDIVEALVHKQPGKRLVGDTMNPEAWSLGPDDDAVDAVSMMLDKQIHRVLVIDNDALVGIITATDILRAVRDGRRFRNVESTHYSRSLRASD